MHKYKHHYKNFYSDPRFIQFIYSYSHASKRFVEVSLYKIGKCYPDESTFTLFFLFLQVFSRARICHSHRSKRSNQANMFCLKLLCFCLPIDLNICFGCLKEPSHRDGSFEHPQHMFWLRNNNNNFQLHTHIWRCGFSDVSLLSPVVSV